MIPSQPARPKPHDVSKADTAKAIAHALAILGYFDRESRDEKKRDPLEGLKKLQTDHNVEESNRIGPRTLTKLAELIRKEKKEDAEGLALAHTLIESAMALSAKPIEPLPASPPTENFSEVFITTVSSNGAIVKLADGSVYEIDVLGQIKTMLWLPTQKVFKVRDGLLNLQNGESVKATAIK